jgi:hypothetical protein
MIEDSSPEAHPAPEATPGEPSIGWHGIIARNQKRYSPDDWRMWGTLGGDVTLVDVAVGSPAWRAEIRNGTWVMLMNQMTFEAFEARRAPVGTTVSVKAFRPGLGHVHPTLTLVDRPKIKREPRRGNRSRIPLAEAGAVVSRSERPKWLGQLCRSAYLSPAARLLGCFFANVAVRNDGWARQWSLDRLVKDLGITQSTLQRSIRELQQAGYLRFNSGRHARRNNSYALAWPVRSERGHSLVRLPWAGTTLT